MLKRGSWRLCGSSGAAAITGTFVFSLVALPLASRGQDIEAHALAQKFAQEGEAPAPGNAADAVLDQVDARRRAAAARQEESLRQAAEAKRRLADARRKADVARRAAAQLRLDEADMLARARAEAEERAADERALQAEIDRAEAERSVATAKLETEQIVANLTPAEREAAEQRLINAAMAADAARKAMEEAREAETRRISEKLRMAQERRAAAEAARAGGPPAAPQPSDLRQLAAPATPPGLPSPSPSVVAGAPVTPIAAEPQTSPPALPSAVAKVQLPDPPTPSVRPPLPETSVTVLILMQPGNRGIRRANKSADPVLCVGETCFVSKGPEQDARRVTRWQALGTFNTLGKRAGACNNALGCVFRNVDLGAAKAMLQPIDLRVMHHDRRETREARADPTCELLAGRLSCAAGIKASDYRLWIVPESLARKAGAAPLEAAVRDGLPDGRRAELMAR